MYSDIVLFLALYGLIMNDGKLHKVFSCLKILKYLDM